MNASQPAQDARLNILLLCADDHRADTLDADRPICLSTPHWDALMRDGATFGAYRDVQRMMRTPRWKLIEYPKINKQQLFDLQNDPHELTDLLLPWRYEKTEYYAPQYRFAEFETIARDLTQQLRVWQKQVGDPILNAG